KAPFGQWNQRAPSNLREHAGRRQRAVLNPLVHIGDQGAPKPLYGIGVVSLLGCVIDISGGGLLRRKGPGEMLEAGQEVGTNVWPQGNVFLAVRRSMDQ